MNSYSKITAFPWLEQRCDKQGLDGYWQCCLHHLFRDVLLYHQIDSPLRVLFRPFHLTFLIDKFGYPWLWDGQEEEFLHPRFNQGVSALWKAERDPLAACDCLQSCLASGRIPIIYLEWFHVPFTPNYKLLRGNLHAAAVLDYRANDKHLYILDRNALPSSKGGLENKQGWVSLESLLEAFQEDFAWLDYRIDETSVPWHSELRSILRESVISMQEGYRFATPSSDHGLQAINGLKHFISHLREADLASPHFRYALSSFLPSCIRKFVVGQRRMFQLILKELESQCTDPVIQTYAALKNTISLWQQFASSLTLFGKNQQEQYQVSINESLIQLTKQEEVLIDHVEKIARLL